MPQLCIFIDEIFDLLNAEPINTEDAISSIAQKGRAVGIHLVITAQRPTSVIVKSISSQITFML